MANTNTPNMGLILPTIGAEASPTYGQDQNSSFTILDGHNHTPGSGVLITPAAIDINVPLTFKNNPAVNLEYVQFTPQISLTGLSSIYVKPGSETVPIADLWFNDGNGVPIQITSNGGINAPGATIPGESYGGGTFTWRQGAGSTIPANFDIGSIILRPNLGGTRNGVILQPPLSISSQYPIVLPLLPSLANSPSIMTIDNSGIISTIPYSAVITNPLTSIGDLLVGGAGGLPTRFPVGVDGSILEANSSAPLGLAWTTIPVTPVFSGNTTTSLHLGAGSSGSRTGYVVRYDSAGAWDATFSRYVAPSTGYYNITASTAIIKTSTTAYNELQIITSSGQICVLATGGGAYFVGSQGNAYLSGSCQIHLNAGDYFFVNVSNNDTFPWITGGIAEQNALFVNRIF